MCPRYHCYYRQLLGVLLVWVSMTWYPSRSHRTVLLRVNCTDDPK
jgi:hypothetical protein